MNVRRSIASFFLLVLAAPLFMLSFLQLKQAYIRHEMEERLEKGLQETVFVSKQEWKRHNSHEIWVAGRLFDVKEIQATASGFLVTGIFDDAETAVLQQVQNTCARQASKDTPVFAQFFQLLHGYFFQDAGQVHFVAGRPAKLFQNPIWHLPLRYKKVLAPPPQWLL